MIEPLSILTIIFLAAVIKTAVLAACLGILLAGILIIWD